MTLTPNAIVPSTKEGKFVNCCFVVDGKVLVVPDESGLVAPKLKLLARHKVLNQVSDLAKTLGLRPTRLSGHVIVAQEDHYLWRSNLELRDRLPAGVKLIGPDEFLSGGQLCSSEYQAALEQLIPEWSWFFKRRAA